MPTPTSARQPLAAAGRCWARVATTTLLLLPLASQADSAANAPGPPWAATEARALRADESRLPAAGWACTQVVDLPSASHPLLALCRRATPAAAELQLVLVPQAPGAGPRVLARLGDASKATVRTFAPAAACGPGMACLAAVVLVDQRDEGLCYGTQVLVAPAGKPVRSLGFINEWSSARSESTCIGGLAQVSGTGADVVIDLPGPLARTGPDGNPQPVAARTVRYRIAADRPALKRQLIGP
jgi:hypothetical protein